MDRRRSIGVPKLALAALLACLGTALHAQDQPTTLGQAVQDGGGSPLQIATANAVQRVCGDLGTNGGFNSVAGEIRAPMSDREDLYFRCNEMVHTANALSGNSNLPTANSLGLSASELARAMQQLGGEENASTTRLATETSNGQFANIGLRLDAIARGTRLTTGSLATAGRAVGPTGGNAGADSESRGWGWFATGAVGFGDRDASLAEDEYEYDSNGITFGADYQLAGGAVLGAALGFANFDIDFTEVSAPLVATTSGGGIEIDGYSVSLFGLAQPAPRVTIDGVLIYGDNDYETSRLVDYSVGAGATGRGAAFGSQNRTLTGNTDSSQWAAGVNVGTLFDWGATTLYLDGGLVLFDAEVDAYVENEGADIAGLNLAYDEQSIESRQARLALHLTRAFSTRSGVISPFVQLEWRHEFENEAVVRPARYANAIATGTSFDLAFQTDPPDEDFLEANVGLVMVLRNNFQLVFDYRTSLELDLVDASLFTFSLRGGL